MSPTEPKLHPLAAALSGWRFLHDVARDTIVILSPAGLWVEVDAESFRSGFHDDGPWNILAQELAASPLTGHCNVEVTRRDGLVLVRLVPVGPPRRGPVELG